MAIIGKDAMFRLVDYTENLYLENLILRDELSGRDQNELEELLKMAKASDQIGDKVRALFAPVRAAILEEAFLEQALQEFLKANPRRK